MSYDNFKPLFFSKYNKFYRFVDNSLILVQSKLYKMKKRQSLKKNPNMNGTIKINYNDMLNQL